MRILIDALGYLTESRNRGIGRYTRELIRSLVENKGSHEIHLLLNAKFSEECKHTCREFSNLIGHDSIHYWMPLDNKSHHDIDTKSIQISRDIYRAKIHKIEPDAVVFSEPFTQTFGCDALSGSGIKTFPILYDLIPAIYPEDYLTAPQQKLWYESKMAEMGNMDGVLTISESSKLEIESLIPAALGKVTSVGCDTGLHFNELATGQCVDSADGLILSSSNFLFYTGGYDYRKSVDLLIKAFSELDEASFGSFYLVLAGGIPEVLKANLLSLAKQLGVLDKLMILGYVDDNELIWLYQNCNLYVNPSKHEGFGLPILEAMRCGCPVLAADNSNANDLLTIEEAKFRTGDKDHLVERLTLILNDNQIRQKIVDYGKSKQKEYSWSNVATATLAAIEESVTSACVSAAHDKDDIYNNLVKDISEYDLSDDDCFAVAKSLNASFNFDKPQLLVDISILIHGDSKTGVQRVVRSILNELLISESHDFNVRPVYFCHQAHYFKYATVDNVDDVPSFTMTESIDSIDLFKDDMFLGLDLNHNIAVNHKRAFDDLVYSPAQVYFVVYDLLPVKYPDFFDAVHQLTPLHLDWLKSISKSDGVMCISQVVCNDFAAFSESNSLKLHDSFKNEPFNLGSDIERSLLSEKAVYEFDFIHSEEFAGRPNILMVGTLEPRKGYETALNAFDELWKESDANLVIVGGRGWKSESLRKRILNHPLYGEKLFWHEGLSDGHLFELYKAVDGLLAASYDEGYGLPIIEAARNQTPVLARDIPVFREVGKDKVIYFGDESPSVLSKTIEGWLKDIEAGSAPIPSDSQVITWKASAAQLLNAISSK